MANVENIEKRLLEIMRLRDPVAVVITGEWGIGKTHLWNNFKEKNHDKFGFRKYAYISLFGIDSLDSLKYEIAIKTQGVSQSKDKLKGAKSLFNKALDAIDLSKIEGSGLSLNIGKSLITSTLSNLVSDTVICIDDIERKSENLSVRDIMGTINDLKTEKNCQVIVILHQDEADTVFHEYKEKVFDEVLLLDDSLSIIKNIVSSDNLFSIYQEFYNTMHIKNLRFYQRVEKTLGAILKIPNKELSLLSKKNILESILIIRMVHDTPSIFGEDIGFDFFVKSFTSPRVDEIRRYEVDLSIDPDETRLDDDTSEVVRKFKIIDEEISKFYKNFEILEWSDIVAKSLIALHAENEIIEELIKSDEIIENQLEAYREKKGLMAEYRSLNPKDDFNQRLFDNSRERIDTESLENLNFYCDILERNGNVSLSKELETLVQARIENRIKEGPENWFIGDYYFTTPPANDKFYSFLLRTINKYKKKLPTDTDNDTLFKVFMNFFTHGNECQYFFETIQNISKDRLSSIIWQPLDENTDRKYYIKKILKHPAFNVDVVKFYNGDRVDSAIWYYKKLIDTPKLLSPCQHFITENKIDEVRQWTIEILQERIDENPSSKAAIEHFLDYTKNLERL